MIFNLVDVLVPPDNVGMYYLNMALAAILLVFMIMKRNKIAEFITAGRVANVSSSPGGGMRGGANRAGNMARTGASHTATKTLAAATGGAAMAQKLRGGLNKARDNFRNARNQSKEGQDQGVGANASNVVNLNDRLNQRNQRTPQDGGSNTQGSEKGEEQSGADRVPTSSSNVSDRSESRNTGGAADESQRGKGKTDDKSGHIAPMATSSSSTADRSNSRNTGGKTNEQSDQKGNVAPVSGLSSKRSMQRNSEETNPGRKNRTPQNGESSGRSSKQQQTEVPLHKQQKEERKQQRHEKRRIRKETNHTAVDKMKDSAKKKRQEMVQNRKKRRGRR